MLSSKLFYIAVLTTFFSFVVSQAQENFMILPNGTLVLAPPPPSITGQSNLPTYDNPSYLGWLYSASDGFVSGISRGFSPIILEVSDASNQTCITQDPLVFQRIADSNPTLYVNWVIGIFILGTFGLLCGFVVCLTCIIVCCCRVFCKMCGAERTQNISPDCTLVNLCVWSPILFVLLLVTFLGCVFGILSYVSLNGYITNLPNNVDTSLGFVNSSINGIVNQLNFTISTQLNSTFEATIIQVRGHFDTSFGNRLNQLADDLNGTVDRFDQLRVSVNMLESTLNTASTFVTNLDNQANTISTQLANLRSSCNSAGLLSSSDCNAIPTMVMTGLSAASIPNISSEVNELNQIDTLQIRAVVANITGRVDSEINTLMGYFTQLDVFSAFDISSFTGVTDQIGSTFDSFGSFNRILGLGGIQRSDFDRYYQIAYSILLAIAILLFSFILVDIILAIIGVLIVLISYDHEAKPSMRKSSSNHASRLLAFTGYAGFCLTWVLAPVLVVLFMFGSFSTTVCQPLIDRSLLQFATPCVPTSSLNIPVGNLGTFTLQINISHIFESCENNENLLQALQADSLADAILDNVTNIIDNTVSNIRGQINTDVISNAITDSYQSTINTYDTSQFNFNAANDISTQLSTTQVSQQITNARTPVQNIIDQIGSNTQPQLVQLRSDATQIIMSLDTIQNVFIPQANTLISNTTSQLATINNDLNAINMSLTQASDTVSQFAANLSTLTGSLVNDSIDSLNSNVMTYISYIRNNLPRCAFLPDIYNAFVDVTCRGIISNFNVFWFCLGWALFFLVVSSIFTFVVARYGVRREHESWFENGIADVDEQISIPPGPRIMGAEPTAPAVFANDQLGIPDQPPPVYTYSENYEMKRFSHDIPAAPVLTQMRGGNTPPPTVAW